MPTEQEERLRMKFDVDRLDEYLRDELGANFEKMDPAVLWFFRGYIHGFHRTMNAWQEELSKFKPSK